MYATSTEFALFSSANICCNAGVDQPAPRAQTRLPENRSERGGLLLQFLVLNTRLLYVYIPEFTLVSTAAPAKTIFSVNTNHWDSLIFLPVTMNCDQSCPPLQLSSPSSSSKMAPICVWISSAHGYETSARAQRHLLSSSCGSTGSFMMLL